jgi:HD-like signal output (HDOD) protein/prolyl-tRNA editing enzyme YbaK/EbsC (Cys-tRNA(Pro) deacylase)
MSVPAAVEKALRKHEIEYGVTEHLESASEHLSTPSDAKSIIMQDSQGQVQVIYPSNSILDIDQLRQLTSRELKPSTLDITQSLCKKIQADHVPSIPQALGLDIIIDTALLDAPELSLDSGNDHNVINIKINQFKKLLDNAFIERISVAESSLNHSTLDDIDDIKDITAAVANFTQIRMKQRLEETLEFPPLPETAQRIIKLRVDPNADIQDLTNIVETDPSLAAQVVSWAASPYYAAPGKIKSVHDAIVRVLGFDLVLNLSLGLALGKTLNLPKDTAKGFTPYWQQAVYTAATVEALVSAIPPKDRPPMGMAYLSGLLHNFGYLILAEVFPPHFSSICRYQEANPYANHSHIERHLLGITREQLSAWLMRLWDMPEEVSTALRFQNEASYKNDDNAYANLLFVAQRLLRQHGYGDAPLEPIPESLFEQIKLDREKASEVVEKVLESSHALNTIASNMAA